MEAVGDILQHRSFPSGHSATAFWAYVMAVGLNAQKPLRWILCVLMVLVGISRMVVGAHFPLDVLAAWVIGGATFVILCANKLDSKGEFGHER